jgi:Cof subfamily protein (haloacid dehalogenase superfamily)
MTPPTRLISIDIDGTLLPSSGGQISERTRRALLEAETAGIEVVIATGRRQAYTAPLILTVGLKPSTVLITSNGTVTRTLAGERIDRFLLPAETARGLCGALRQFGGLTVFTFDREGPGELILESTDLISGRMALWVDANRQSIQEINPLEDAFNSGEEPVQGMICGTVATMRQTEAWLAESEFAGKIELHRTEYPARELSILDILPPGCSKGYALAKLAEARNIAPDEIMAIGDNFNDLEMLKFAGQPVVMGNGAPEMVRMAQDRGWMLAETNDEDGVAQVIESVLEAARVQSVGRLTH